MTTEFLGWWEENGKRWSPKGEVRRVAWESWVAGRALSCSREPVLEEEVRELRAEVREWVCDGCNVVYPGPPQGGFLCVRCPRCGGNTMTRVTAMKERHTAEKLALESEVNRLRNVIAMGTFEMGDWVVRVEQMLGEVKQKAAWMSSQTAHPGRRLSDWKGEVK
jgi:hypothetical protein